MTTSSRSGRTCAQDRHFVPLLCVLYLFLSTFSMPGQAESAAVGTAREAIGTLVIVRVDGIEERLRGEGALALFEGDVLRTDGQSSALIELNDGIQVGLDRNTSFKIISRWEKEQGSTRILRLKEGVIWVKISGGSKRFEVETPVAIAAVKGTEFIIETLKNGNSTLTVIEGLVEFGTAFGTCPIRTSTVSYAVPGRKCTKPAKVDVKPAVHWTAKLRGGAAAPPPPPPPAPAPPAETATALPVFWPPPEASTRQKIPRDLLAPRTAQGQTWGSVADRLEKALADNGYSSPGYYLVPQGFALISQLERINPDATPAPSEVRWKIKVDPVSIRPFNLEAYLKALLGEDAGLFRVIAFVFTPVPIVTKGKASMEAASGWVEEGASTLPQTLSQQAYGENMEATALIYEFEVPSRGKPARLNKPSGHNGQQHLKAARILQALGG